MITFGNIYYRFMAAHSVKGVSQGILERRKVFPVEEVIQFYNDAIAKGDRHSIIDGVVVRVTGQTLMTFAEKGYTCCECGLQGAYFALERHPGAKGKSAGWFFNLYAINEEGEEIFMNKDHIIPRSRGGKNSIDNYNPMCVICNGKKSNRVEGKSRGWKLRKIKQKRK